MSRNHRQLSGPWWERTRRAALRRAGYRSEVSGKAGRLECHHRVPLDAGGAPYDLDNIVVMTRDEHIRHHGRDHLLPGRAKWLDYLKTLT